MNVNVDGCCHVFVDVGSNIGVQVRKVFEPHRYPNAEFHPVFDSLFGNQKDRKTSVCAIGLEANPNHSPRLRAIESAYAAHGWRAQFLTPVAASTEDGNITFYVDNSHERVAKGTQWWASTVSHRYNRGKLAAEQSAASVQVPAVDLSGLLQRNVLTRRLPSDCSIGRVMMKIDVEGAGLSIRHRP